jgi:hypothetical protein
MQEACQVHKVYFQCFTVATLSFAQCFAQGKMGKVPRTLALRR